MAQIGNLKLVEPDRFMIFTEEDILSGGSDLKSAILRLVLSPHKWPEDVDFWLQLSAMSIWGIRAKYEWNKRGTFEAACLVRHIRRECSPGLVEYNAVDFWFLVNFVDAAAQLRSPIMWGDLETDRTGLIHDVDWSKSERRHHLIKYRKGWDKGTPFFERPEAFERFGLDPWTLPR